MFLSVTRLGHFVVSTLYVQRKLAQNLKTIFDAISVLYSMASCVIESGGMFLGGRDFHNPIGAHVHRWEINYFLKMRIKHKILYRKN